MKKNKKLLVIAVLLLLVTIGFSYAIYRSSTTANGTVNLTLPYELYVPCNCQSAPGNVPAYIQVQSTGVALTSGTSNLIVSKE